MGFFFYDFAQKNDYIISGNALQFFFSLIPPCSCLSSSLFLHAGWDLLALIAKSHLVRALVLFLECITHVDRCLPA